MSLVFDFELFVNEVVSLIDATGMFDQVNAHQPDNKPGNGATCSVWADSIGSDQENSGLSSTAGLLVVNVRIFNTMTQQPYDQIDVSIVNAAAAVLGLFSGNFTLSANVKNVDLMKLNAKAGYMKFGGANMRVMTVEVPMIINDVWDQVE